MEFAAPLGSDFERTGKRNEKPNNTLSFRALRTLKGLPNPFWGQTFSLVSSYSPHNIFSAKDVSPLP